MSARDDYPAMEYRPTSLDAEREIAKALDEIDELRRWKAEAMAVLSDWENVWEGAGRPGSLGASKATAVLGLLQDRAEEAL